MEAHKAKGRDNDTFVKSALRNTTKAVAAAALLVGLARPPEVEGAYTLRQVVKINPNINNERTIIGVKVPPYLIPKYIYAIPDSVFTKKFIKGLRFGGINVTAANHPPVSKGYSPFGFTFTTCRNVYPYPRFAFASGGLASPTNNAAAATAFVVLRNALLTNVPLSLPFALWASIQIQYEL